VRWLSLVLTLLSLAGPACAPRPTELSPSEALTAFLTALDRSTHAPEQLQVAYEWLDRDSQAALRERAALSASLAGRSIAAWDMLVPGRSSFSAYSVPSLRTRTRQEGERAFVTLSQEGRGDVEIALVRQEGRWRVVLGLAAHASE
jgi:hypothetical protein